MSLPERPAGDSVEGFVLAGGRSSRMGTDKALALFAGEPLVTHAVKTLRDAGLKVSIAGARSVQNLSAPVLEDAEPGRGPLAGVCSALASTSNQLAVVVPVDLPLLPAALISYLLQYARITGAAVTVPSVNGFAQTFPAVVRREALLSLRETLRAGDGGCYSAFQAAAARLHLPLSIVPAELLAQSGQVVHPHGLAPSFWFWNLNTPDDLERAEELLAVRHGLHRVS
ncbi:MAG TPA: molybdenum cofactor guanylyltransferase [Terriglobia bacterium]|nr:molybdenum cofactor guanylyltransferase [Terriglobia bacterium]